MNNQASTSTNNVHQNPQTFEISHEDPLFINFHSHLLDHNEFLYNTILPYQTPPQPTPQVLPIMEEKGKQKAVIGGPKGDPNKRVGKKDRHSKINTAHGPRDRRMRLSLQIARKFFDLQDMLGFDKASKTIEWLFTKSKSAIKDLANTNSNNPTSPINTNDDNNVGGGEDICGGDGSREEKIKKQVVESKGGLRTKESRAKAREWARKRTKEKLMMKKEQNKNPKIIRVSNNCNNNNYYYQQKSPLEDQMASVDIIERFVATSSCSCMSDFHHDCDHNHDFGHDQMRGFADVVGFNCVPGNWCVQNGRLI